MPQVQIQYKTLKILDYEIDQYFKKISKYFWGGKNIGKIKIFKIVNC